MEDMITLSFRDLILIGKFKEEDKGWSSRGVRDGYTVGVRKTIRHELEGIQSRSHFLVENGRRVEFWKDLWRKDQTLEETFPNLSYLAANKDRWVAEARSHDQERGGWSPHCSRGFNN